MCTFDPASPRTTAYDIHEWIHDVLNIPKHTVTVIQIDGTKRQVYIKLIDKTFVQVLLRDTNGRAEYKHLTGELSLVSISVAGMGTKRVRITNLPPEVPDDGIRAALAPFGTVLAIMEEMWSKTYGYAVANGISQVTIKLSQPVTSHLTVAGHRVLLSCEGQPATCYGCGDIGYLYPTCPMRQNRGMVPRNKQHMTYATVVATTASTPPTQSTNTTYDILHNTSENRMDSTSPKMDVTCHVVDVCVKDANLSNRRSRTAPGTQQRTECSRKPTPATRSNGARDCLHTGGCCTLCNNNTGERGSSRPEDATRPTCLLGKVCRKRPPVTHVSHYSNSVTCSQ